jgi:hypothetical protein
VTLGHDEAVALAGGLTGVLAVPLAVSTFFADRVSSARRNQQTATVAFSAALSVSGLYAAVCAALAWWAWDQAIAPHATLLVHMSPNVAFALLFAPPVAFAVICFVSGLVLVITAAVASGRKRDP